MTGPPMAGERGFEDYLSRHLAHLGDPERYRARRKRQLIATYRRFLPESRDAELLEIGPGYGQWLEAGFYLPPSAYEVGFLSAAHSPNDVERLVAAL